MSNKYKNKKLQVDKEEEYFKRLEVKVRQPWSDESVGKALSQFKRIIKKSGLFKDLQEKRYFQKKSDKLRLKKQLAILRNKYSIRQQHEAENKNIRNQKHYQRRNSKI